jgi:DNA topoisomerase-1
LPRAQAAFLDEKNVQKKSAVPRSVVIFIKRQKNPQLMYELIITEKPTAAKKIAEALADGKTIKDSKDKVPFYKITRKKKDIIVACAVGHLYSVAEKEKSFSYPSFNVEWKATADVDKGAAFSRKYLNTIKTLAKDANEFTVACDYDIEGEVIGLNIIRYACKRKDARRMKFSTLLKEDLIEAYEHVHPTIDWGQALAGETRHIMDWMYGINLSRALTTAIKKAGMFKILSTGRVQGPALKIVVDKEIEIRNFKSQPFWQLVLLADKHATEIIFMHQHGDFWEKIVAEGILKKCQGQPAVVSSIATAESRQKPPTPFDLGTLQTESYRVFGISPKDTLACAQSLYLDGLTSYPRTSSQQYPGLDFKKIITQLGKQPSFKEKTAFLLKKSHLTPMQGKKTDPAHPAIYPTGLLPGNIGDRERRVYDLIVKRFFAVFGDDAIRETVTVTVAVEQEHFVAKGTRTTTKGWHDLYEPYVKLQEIELPAFKDGEFIKVKSIDLNEKETQPPKRYTQASIVSELEKRNLGTKATRAEIVDGLIRRGFAADKPITATELGMKMTAIIERHIPDLVDEQLTRSFEEEMDKIREKQMTEEQVLDHAKKTLIIILTKFLKEEADIGKELLDSEKETRDLVNTLGPCPKCKVGNLKVLFSKKFKRRFIACDKYPDCKTTLPLPQGGMIKPTDELCPKCNYPMLLMRRPRSGPQKYCINPECPDKHTETKKEMSDIEKNLEGRMCPKCGKKLLLRSSMYGKFIGCSGYPACRYLEKLNGEVRKDKFEKKTDDGKTAEGAKTTAPSKTVKTVAKPIKEPVEKKTASNIKTAEVKKPVKIIPLASTPQKTDSQKKVPTKKKGK